jgi:hypothetical protein
MFGTANISAYLSLLLFLNKAVTWLRQLLAGFLGQRPVFDIRKFHLESAAEKFSLEQINLQVLQCPINIIPTVIYTHVSFIYTDTA